MTEKGADSKGKWRKDEGAVKGGDRNEREERWMAEQRTTKQKVGENKGEWEMG